MTLAPTQPAGRAVERVPDLYRSFNWSNEALWSLVLPVREVPMEHLAWLLRAPVWSTVPRERRFDLQPLTVLEFPDEHRWHYDRILAAPVHIPIDVAETADGDVVLDGVHRLARLWMEGADRIRIRRVTREQLALIQSDDFPDD